MATNVVSFPLKYTHTRVATRLTSLCDTPQDISTTHTPFVTHPHHKGAWIVGLDAEGAIRLWCILHPHNPRPGDPKLPDQVCAYAMLFCDSGDNS